MAKLTFAGVKADDSSQYFQQGGLTGAVRPNQDNSFVPLNLKVEGFVHLKVAVRLAQLLESDHSLAASTGLWEGEPDLLRRDERCLDFLHPLNLLQFTLCLSGLCVLGAKPIHKFHQALNLLLLVFIGS